MKVEDHIVGYLQILGLSSREGNKNLIPYPKEVVGSGEREHSIPVPLTGKRKSIKEGF
jgi:hypothetical protein